MKFSTATLIVLGCAPLALAQSTKNPKSTQMVGPTISITAVEVTQGYEPHGVTIQGTGLGLVTQARIDGVAVPILHRSESSMVIAPPPQIPGFPRLELLSAAGRAESAMEFLPTIQTRASSDELRMTVRCGEPGIYWIYYSLNLRSSPTVLPGIFYGSMLDMALPPSGLLLSGATDGRPVHLNMAIPPGYGFPVHFQGLCVYMEPDGQSWSFTNVFTETFEPKPTDEAGLTEFPLQ